MRLRFSPLTLPLVASAALGLAACDGGVGAAPPGGRDSGPRMDAGVVDGPGACARPEEGCPCDHPDGYAIDCYPDAETRADGSRTCFRGTRTCRDGAWSGCESLESWVDEAPEGDVGRAGAPLIGTTEECDSCNPSCSTTTDEPDCGDVDPADGLECCGPPDGLCLIPMEPPPPPPPMGCQIYYEVGFRETANHTYSVTLPNVANEVSVYPEDDSGTTIDERFLVESVTATGCATCAPGASGRYCQGCPAADTLTFEVVFQNEIVLPTTTDQLLEFDLVVVQDESTMAATVERQHVCLQVNAIDTSTCLGSGYGCTDAAQCCTGVCSFPPSSTRTDWTPGSSGECGTSASVCLGEGAACAITADCCEGACNAGVCDSSAACADVGDVCTMDGDCCGNDCSGGTCQARSCVPKNGPCSNDGECCSRDCKSNGSCAGPDDICAVTGSSCTDGDPPKYPIHPSLGSAASRKVWLAR